MVDATLDDKNSLNQQILFAECEIANDEAGNARDLYKKQTFIVQQRYLLQSRFGILVPDGFFLVGAPIPEGEETVDATSAEPWVGGYVQTKHMKAKECLGVACMRLARG